MVKHSTLKKLTYLPLQLFNFYLLVLTSSLKAQSQDTLHSKYISIGAKHAGICFGNCRVYSGLRANIIDKYTHKVNGINMIVCGRRLPRCDSNKCKVNGINVGFLLNNAYQVNGLSFAIFTDGGTIHKGANKVNGIEIGVFGCSGDETNGLGIGGFFYCKNRINGVAISYIGCVAKKINGMAAASLLGADTLNGIFGGGCIEVGTRNKYHYRSIVQRDTTGQLNGVAISFFTFAANVKGLLLSLLGNSCFVQKGLSIGLFNYAQHLDGVQIGLINYAANTRILCLPIINMHFKKGKKQIKNRGNN